MEPEWINIVLKKPIDGQMVVAYGNPTFCCEEDMDEKGLYICKFEIVLSEWREHADGTKYDVKTVEIFKVINNESYTHMENVDYWFAVPSWGWSYKMMRKSDEVE